MTQLPALPPTTDELLLQMQSVLYTRTCAYEGYKYCARARGCELYGHGATPRAAMLDALEIKKGLEK